MNRKIRSERIMLVMAFALMVLVTGCKENVIQPLPEVNFQTQELEVDPEGGSYSVGYTVENPSQDGVLQLSKDVDWITDLTSTDVLVSFHVSSNLSFDEDREGNVVISYLGVSDTLRVIQPKSEVSADNMKIDITVNSVTSKSINAVFEPSNADSSYYVAAVSKTEFSEYSGDAGFIEAQVKTFSEEAISAGISLEEYLEYYVLKSGEISKDFVGLTSSTEYYVIAFALSAHGVPGTRLFKVEAKTEGHDSEVVDVEFELSANVNGKEVAISVNPSDETVRYYQSYVAVDYLEYLQMDLRESIKYTIEEELYYATEAGLSLSEVIDELSSWGPVEYTAELYSTSRHILYAVAIDELGNLVSDVDSLSFAMENVKSDNTITLGIEEVGVDNAVIMVTTTTEDPYIIGVGRAVDWSGFTDEQIATAILYRGSDIYSGDQTFRFKYLSAGTDYVVAAVGYDAGTFTTNVVKSNFSTQALGDMEDMEFEFTIDNITPFGADISVSATPETNLYYWYYKQAWMSDEDVMADVDMIIQNFISMGIFASRLQYFQVTGSRGNDFSEFTSMSPDTEYRAFAVGIDETSGNYATPIFFSEPFRTREREDVDITVEAYVKDYYDINELVEAGYDDYAAYQGYAVANMAAEISGSVECKDYYFHMSTADLTDEDLYSEDKMLEVLFDYGFNNIETVQVVVPYDKICTLMAVGLDENGNPGKLYRKNIVFTKDGAGNVDEFVPVDYQSPASVKGIYGNYKEFPVTITMASTL